MVTRGDNIPADDPWDTRLDDVVGTARIRVSNVGPVIQTLGRPYVMGALAALTVMFLVMARRDPEDAAGDDRPRVAPPIVTLAAVVSLLGGALVVGQAASLIVTADDLVSFSYPGPFDTYVDNPGGGGGPGGGPGGGGGGGGPP